MPSEHCSVQFLCRFFLVPEPCSGMLTNCACLTVVGSIVFIFLRIAHISLGIQFSVFLMQICTVFLIYECHIHGYCIAMLCMCFLWSMAGIVFAWRMLHAKTGLTMLPFCLGTAPPTHSPFFKESVPFPMLCSDGFALCLQCLGLQAMSEVSSFLRPGQECVCSDSCGRGP